MASTIEARGLITTVGGEQHLIGARCDTCATHAFPGQATCPRCGATMSPTVLPATGTVWSWTVQRIRPKLPYVGPDDHEPFAVGYVDLGPVRVESRLEGKPAGAWRIDDPVRLAAGEPDEQGDIWSYRFVDDRVDSGGARS